MELRAEAMLGAEEERWAALVRRDMQADGRFWYGVQTTGVYCRPTCASRLPRRDNVRFFDSPGAAEGAGFRACKRCQPRAADANEEQQRLVRRACAILEAAEEPISLGALAAEVGLSPFYFQRLFKRLVGVTPRQFAAAQRQRRVQARLQQDGTVTEALYNAGFGSSSRFYDMGDAALGMKPSEFQKGGRGVTIQFAIADCPLGKVLVAATARGICAIDLGDSAAELEARLRQRFPQATLSAGDAAFERTVRQVVAFIEAPREGLALPLDIQGTAFQQRVWAALQAVPPGSTVSYAELAARIGQPTAARAVAQACGANTLAVAVPCHRVVGQNGALSGYRWGVERKRALLEREGGLLPIADAR